jgi:putative DNA primase/helicase
MSDNDMGIHAPFADKADHDGQVLLGLWMDCGIKKSLAFPVEDLPTANLQELGKIIKSALDAGLVGFPFIAEQYPNHVPQLAQCATALSSILAMGKKPTAKKIIADLTRYRLLYDEQMRRWQETESDGDVFSDEPAPPKNRIEGLPFRLLGMDDGVMRYMPDNGQHIVSMTAGGHTKLNLLQLAPLQSWAEIFPSKQGCDWDAACNCIIQMSQSLPRFDPRSIRGRGCWIDGNDVIYHAGNKLAVNGQIRPITAYSSPSIYEAGLAIAIDTADSAKNIESARLLELCDALSWDQPLYGKLIAGWMALAPICGAMQWRPHVWVTGAAGSGKTWIMGNIINPIVGKSAVFVQGNTSEAGIRGQLGSDALPVLFDEAEAENLRSITRMESVMELARQASTESGAGIVKGTQNGGSITYMVRSMFCFSSIGVAAVKKADTSRISVLALRKADNQDQFNLVKSIWRETTANPEYCARIRARAVKNAKTTRKNADTFSQCAVDFTGDKRSADQIGTLLAGAYSLASSRPITSEAATEWLQKQDWSGFKVDAIDSDENQCLSHLMSAIIRVERNGSAENISIDEAITRCRAGVSCEPDNLALLRIGIKVDQECVFVANSHQGLDRVFRETAWSGGKWRGQMLRICGAESASHAVRFGKNIRQRAVSVPI